MSSWLLWTLGGAEGRQLRLLARPVARPRPGAPRPLHPAPGQPQQHRAQEQEARH